MLNNYRINNSSLKNSNTNNSNSVPIFMRHELGSGQASRIILSWVLVKPEDFTGTLIDCGKELQQGIDRDKLSVT